MRGEGTALVRRWCDGGGMVLTRMLYGGEKVFLLPLTRRLDYRLPKGREQVDGRDCWGDEV